MHDNLRKARYWDEFHSCSSIRLPLDIVIDLVNFTLPAKLVSATVDHALNSPRSAFASFKSFVSKPSVNQA